MSTPRVLFVTNELYPLARGGIGRLLYNYIQWNAAQEQPAELHVLLMGGVPESGKRWAEDGLEDITLHDGDSLGQLTPEQKDTLAPSNSATFNDLRAHATVIANAVEALWRQLGQRFDYIEFPDFKGHALVSIRRKLERNPAFIDSAIVVRLHSSMSMIQADEGASHYPSEWFSAIADAERYCLKHADLVVGHLESIVEQNRQHYGLGADWSARAWVEFPPILLTETERQAAEQATIHQADSQERQVFVFSSRLQPFKRPDLFIRAAAAFLRRNPDRQDLFVVMSYGWNENLTLWLGSLIPPDLADRIVMRTDFTASERAELMSHATLVIPSTFESLCLLAYESYLFGRRVILNGQSRAFGQAPFWQNEETCLLFDGSVEGLCQAMERSLDFRPDLGRELPPTVPYWTRGQDEATSPSTADSMPSPASPQGRAASLDLLVTDVFPAQIEPHQVTGFQDANVVGRTFLFKDRLYDPDPAELSIDGATVFEVYGAYVDYGALDQAFRTSEADYILLAPAGTLPAPAWVEYVQGALQGNGAAMFAFSAARALGAARALPLLDCPNLLAAGREFQVLPVAVHRQTALGHLHRLSPSDYLVEQLVMSIALADHDVHVLDLPLIMPRHSAIHRYTLSHYLADRLSAERRAHSAHLAAYNLDSERTSGAPYSDEWSVLPRPQQEVPHQAPAPIEPQSETLFNHHAQALSGRGMTLSGYGLRCQKLSPTSCSLSVRLHDLELDMTPLGDLQFDLRASLSDMEVVFDAIPGALFPDWDRLSPGPDGRHLIIHSRSGGLPSVLDGTTPQQRDLLRIIVFIAEYIPLWCARAFQVRDTAMTPELEETLVADSDRIIRLCGIVAAGSNDSPSGQTGEVTC